MRLGDRSVSLGHIEPLKARLPPRVDQWVVHLASALAQVERDLIRRALEACDWNKVHAAAMLKISKKRLYAKTMSTKLERAAARTEQAE
jgi:DNA-binding NtrC family response regulator